MSDYLSVRLRVLNLLFCLGWSSVTDKTYMYVAIT